MITAAQLRASDADVAEQLRRIDAGCVRRPWRPSWASGDDGTARSRARDRTRGEREVR